MRQYLFLLLLSCGFAFVLPALWVGSPISAIAWADDDNGDNGDNGGDSDNGDSDNGDNGDDDDDRDDDRDDDDRDDRSQQQRSGSGGGNFLDRLFGRPAPAQQAPRPAPAPPLPERAADEIVVLDLSEADLATLTGLGYEVLREAQIATLGSTVRRLRVPPGTALEAALDQIQQLPTGQSADFNHFYRANEGIVGACEGLHCASFDLVGLRPSGATAAGCGQITARIGLIDTGINPDHEAFDGGRLSVLAFDGGDEEASGAQHGTAVAAILIGSRAGRAHGLLPEAELVAVDAFYRAGRDERSDVFSLVQAMDQLAVAEVRVINMSLAGPHNVLLEQMVMRLHEAQILIVSAAGNEGPRADPVFPGGYAPVLTVTAVDASGRVYRRAGRGPHLDLAAPGVEVWTAASIRGVRSKTGTSFAAPFATAAAAMLISSRPELTVAEVKSFLKTTALDLGDEGPDEVFGSGLVQFAPICSGPSGTPPLLLE
ncbi:S8 family serine peptidase [Roseobacter sinensis]|uniref:S8 family serine peptidase n=1 Tax=Roseobacter sinensis TaxID=2931391 RepID=A0ABT3BCK2_9RHOB|nr:S8 family serine peptidase [Roseobacter sp. WL0113]MCV3271305.1 S8 family serine peptidase [Roseobacter sp. WL0113]